MRRPLSSLIITGFITVLAISLMTCSFPVSGHSTPLSGRGSLTIALTNNINAKTLTPAISMDAASYTVTGTGPNSATFTATSTGAAVTEHSLAFGNWTIVVNALNASGDLIGTGTAMAQVNTGATTTVSVSVTPISGTGTLSLTVNWPATQVQTPSITASLTPALGTAQSLTFTVSGSAATYTNAAVGNGYYTLAFTVNDNGIAEAGAVEVVRIVAGQTTSGTYTFANVNQAGGGIQVNINANMQNPLEVAIVGSSATMSAGSSETLTASLTNYSGNVSYIWYVNGVSQAAGAGYTFGSGVSAGYYRIDVVAYTADGSQAGSATTNVQMTAGVSGAWQVVGAGDLGQANDITLAIDSKGTPYVAYSNYIYPYGITVMKYSGGSWQAVGTASIGSGGGGYTSLAIDSHDTPYVAFADLSQGSKETVMIYSGGSWQSVGTPGFSAGWAFYTSLALDSIGTPYVAYSDNANSRKATVMKYTSGSWQAVGSVGFSAAEADNVSLAIDPSGIPYVAYTDSGNSSRATVMKYMGGSWQAVGSAGFSAPEAYTTLAIDATGTPYVGFMDFSNSQKATVMKYAAGSWQVVGAAGFSQYPAYLYHSLAFDFIGTLYVAYIDAIDGGSGNSVTVVKYIAGSWKVVGTPDFSPGIAEDVTLAVDPSGIPYVAYFDAANNYKATVMCFK